MAIHHSRKELVSILAEAILHDEGVLVLSLGANGIIACAAVRAPGDRQSFSSACAFHAPSFYIRKVWLIKCRGRLYQSEPATVRVGCCSDTVAASRHCARCLRALPGFESGIVEG